jgi:hypothetical protein
MKLAAITAGVLLAAAAGPTRAADTPAGAEVQRLLQGAADPGDFADLSSGAAISLRHKSSGLVCLFGPDPRGNSLHASPEGLICGTSSETEIDTLEAFHTPQTSESDVQGAVARALGQFRGAEPVNGFTDAKPGRPNTPPHVSLRFVASTQTGDKLFVRIAYSQVGEWFVLQRVISAPGSARLADADAEQRLLTAVGQVMDRVQSSRH